MKGVFLKACHLLARDPSTNVTEVPKLPIVIDCPCPQNSPPDDAPFQARRNPPPPLPTTARRTAPVQPPACARPPTMAMALVSSVDNSPMSTYRGFGGASLNTGDIAGARPRVLTRERRGLYPQWNEPLNKPKRLHPPHMHTDSSNNRPVMNLTNKDIPGSMTHGQYKSKRHVNPLEPDYPLPSYEHRPFTPPSKAARDLCLNTTDIEGSSPKPRFQYEMRDTINAGDIEGTTTDWRTCETRYFGEGSNRDLAKTDSLNVADINAEARYKAGAPALGGKGAYKTQRSTNPLEPQYNYDTQNRARWPDNGVGTPTSAVPSSEDYTIGPIEKSGPTPARGLRNDPEYNMMNEMDGARPGWKKPLPPRRHWTRTNYIDDIHGTSHTHTRGTMSDMGPKPFSKRHTNPVDPNYDQALRPRPAASLRDRHPILRRGSSASSQSSMPAQAGSPHNVAAAARAAAPPTTQAPAAQPALSLPVPKPASPASKPRAMSARSGGSGRSIASSARSASGAQTARPMPSGGGGNYGATVSLVHHGRGHNSGGNRTPGGHNMSSSYSRRGWQ
jgi:hypothetical protein